MRNSEKNKDDHVVLSCKGLVKSYGSLVAVNGIDLEIYRGECFGMLGPNGAGKTTTIEIFEGLTEWDAGEVKVLNTSWSRRTEMSLRERLGVQLQETQLPEKLTVFEIVRLFRSFYRGGLKPTEVIEWVGLTEKSNARIGKLSGGQRQRLAIACSLVGEPELLFLDEPTTGLDPQGRLKIWELIDEYIERGGTVLLTTHYMEEADRLCDRVAIIDRGQVIALDSPAQLIDSLGSAQVLEFYVEGTLDIQKLAALPGLDSVKQKNGGYLLTVDSVGRLMPVLLAEIERQQVVLKTLETHQATLEDVFVSLTGRALRDE
jgi:ABC-2 type transport system ATP-binding protein